MAHEPRRNRDEDDRPTGFWKGLARDALVAGLIVAVFLGALYLYAGVWPPLVVVESSSMQHGSEASSLGVIDTGDMVFQQAASTRNSVITYIEGRANGYSTYGDYGDVIIFRRAGTATPIIHRAIMYVNLHANLTADVPDILLLPTTDWLARNAAGPTLVPMYLKELTILHMGYQHNLDLTFNFGVPPIPERTGYVTKGDNNADHDPFSGVPRLQDVQGRARGEIPWLGLVKLTIQPTDTCCRTWGDMEAPKNSWDSLLVTLMFLVALPFILEYVARGWTKFVSPHLPRIPWPWRKSKGPQAHPEEPGDSPEWEEEEPP